MVGVGTWWAEGHSKESWRDVVPWNQGLQEELGMFSLL